MDKLVLSNSRINTFRRCHYAHFLKYVRRLEQKKKQSPLIRGSAIHECLEAYNNGKSWKKVHNKFEQDFMDSTVSIEREELGDIPGMVHDLMLAYTYAYDEDELEFVENELHFELPLVDDIMIQGYIDAVVKKNGRFHGMEYKTFAKSPDLDFLVFNNQSAIYTWASQQLGFDFSGIIWDIIKAKRPSKPKLTAKTGKLSSAALDSVPVIVEQGIIELGLDPQLYRSLIDSTSYSNYFKRHSIIVQQPVVDKIMEDTRSTAIQIAESQETCKDRNLGKDCSWCSYKSICQAELMNLDVDFIIKRDYVDKNERDKKEATHGKENKGIKQSTRRKDKVKAKRLK